MRLTRSILPITVGIFLNAAAPILVRADETLNSTAARYIRTLFDATLQEGGGLSRHCEETEALGRFAAGQLWHTLPDPERTRFSRDFCYLAGDAVRRLRTKFPGLTLELGASDAAPLSMLSMHSIVFLRDEKHWKVDWLIAGLPEHPHVADLQILGMSLGIFLRSLTIQDWSQKAPQAMSSAVILHPWRLALDRALPSAGIAPPW